MTGFSTWWSGVSGIAARQSRAFFTNPALIIPGLLFPMLFFAAFAGGLSDLNRIPGFDYAPGYTSFQYVFVLFQSSMFGGIFIGFAVARDLFGQIGQHRQQRLLESLQPRIGSTRDLWAAFGFAGREHHQRVGGRRVAIDGHGVERIADAVLEQRL